MPARQQPPAQRLELAGGTQYYVQSGSGPAVLLIHGSLCDYRYWRWQMHEFARTHQVLAPSLAGCWPDDSRHPSKAYSIEAHARSLCELLRHVQAAQAEKTAGFHVLGHSRGAQVAVALARMAPDLCNSLILADPGFRFDDEPETSPFYARSVDLLARGQVDAALELFIDTVNGTRTWSRMVGWFKDMARDNAATLVSQIREANLPVSRDSVTEIHCPVMLVGGARSPDRYIQRLDRLQGMIGTARRVRIPLAAHGMNLANPRAFNREVLGFVESVED